ncbi:unknown [Clostridium sp. CAG:307]|nr:unknown [Clostridium sp. CAG:307]
MRRIKYISDLYMKIYLNTKNLIILIATLFVLAVVSYYNLSLGFDKAEFVFIKDDYIANYLESTSNFLMILNCVIIPTLFLSELKEEVNTINFILIPRVTRVNLNFSKLITSLKIAFYYSLVQVLIIGIIPLIWYPNFIFKVTFLKIGIFIILYSCFNVVLILLMMKILRIFIVDAIPLIIYLALNFVKENIKIRKYFPILVILNQNIENNISLYILIFLIIFLSIIYISKK